MLDGTLFDGLYTPTSVLISAWVTGTCDFVKGADGTDGSGSDWYPVDCVVTLGTADFEVVCCCVARGGGWGCCLGCCLGCFKSSMNDITSVESMAYVSSASR